MLSFLVKSLWNVVICTGKCCQCQPSPPVSQQCHDCQYQLSSTLFEYVSNWVIFSEPVNPLRSPSLLILLSIMILARCLIGLILASFPVFVEGDRVGDAIDSGESFYILFIICDPDLCYEADLCYKASRAKHLMGWRKSSFLPGIFKIIFEILCPEKLFSRDPIGSVLYSLPTTRIK